MVVAGTAQGNRWLSHSSLRFIAKISYGMCMWNLVTLQLITSHVPAPEGGWS